MKFLAVLLVIGALWAGAFYLMDQKKEAHVSAPEVSYTNASEDAIIVKRPDAGDEIAHTFQVSGEARGTWYFEASFPIEVRDASGALLYQGPVSADGEWMTTEFVPFSQTITVPGEYAGPATLILKKDNPSGEPDKDASVSIPVVFE